MHDELLSVVRVLDRPGRRHLYGAGAIPTGDLIGELGSLYTRGGPTRKPVWLTVDQRLVADQYEPAPPRLRLGTVARWLAAPLSWRGFATLSSRLRTVAWRLAALGSLTGGRRRRGGERPVEPAGWLEAQPRRRSIPLFSAVHPVTGDQLLTRDRWEAVDLGYVDVELLGYLDSAKPLTGTRVTARPELPWASRLGQAVRTDAEPTLAEPRGQIEAPGPNSVVAPFTVSGWALGARAPAAAVELLVDGRPAGRARLGLERLGVAREMSEVDAPICGFDGMIGREHVPPDAIRVSVSARVRDLEGGAFVLGAAEVDIGLRSAPYRAPRSDRRRQTRPLRKERTPPGEGTNVLVVTHRLDYGGAQLWLHELIERLVARPGISLSVVATGDGPLRAPLEELGVPVHVIAEYPLQAVDEYEGALASLALWAAPHGFDIALVNALRSFPAIEVADMLAIPSVFAIHESFDLEAWWASAYPPDSVHPYVQQRGEDALGLATAAVFEAEATRQLHLAHAKPERFLTLPYGIELADVDRFRAGFDRATARQRFGLAPDATVVLCLGLIEPRKAQTCLTQAFAALADQHPGAVLALVGESTLPRLAAHNAALREYLARVGLGARVRVVPIADNPYEWLGVADLLVCPSDIESLPRVVLEAMAFELPVLATRIFGVPEVIADGRTGWLCEPRDVGALAGALDRALCARRDRAAELGREAARVVRARHDAAVYANRFAALLEGLAARPGADPATLVALRSERLST